MFVTPLVTATAQSAAAISNLHHRQRVRHRPGAGAPQGLGHVHGQQTRVRERPHHVLGEAPGAIAFARGGRDHLPPERARRRHHLRLDVAELEVHVPRRAPGLRDLFSP
jgi:hypothetical protein